MARTCVLLKHACYFGRPRRASSPTRALRERIAGRPVECAERDRDRYGRIVAVCRVAGADVNAWMVEQGWAVAYRKYSTDYVSEEAAAKAERRGVWRGEFVEPSRWRRGERLETAAAGGAGDCRIKGNISEKGTRIYHVSGGASYAKTRIDTAKGERWFCSEAQAWAAEFAVHTRSTGRMPKAGLGQAVAIVT